MGVAKIDTKRALFNGLAKERNYGSKVDTSSHSQVMYRETIVVARTQVLRNDSIDECLGVHESVASGGELLANASFCSGQSNETRAERATDGAPDCSKHR